MFRWWSTDVAISRPCVKNTTSNPPTWTPSTNTGVCCGEKYDGGGPLGAGRYRGSPGLADRARPPHEVNWWRRREIDDLLPRSLKILSSGLNAPRSDASRTGAEIEPTRSIALTATDRAALARLGRLLDAGMTPLSALLALASRRLVRSFGGTPCRDGHLPLPRFPSTGLLPATGRP